ncbi:ANTAR domain-containing protein [Streptomyces sp. NPDC101165]|uniref:ANTAR domain-containing protein n=1 Tax=Streptomyces sp. NPDC101165 TaxID=3366119 RepID=UPI0038056412
MGCSHRGNTGSTAVGALLTCEDLHIKICCLRGEIHQLQEAVVSHAVIDQAIGVVMAVGGLCPDQGIEVLGAVSRRTGLGLPTIARLLVDWAGADRLPDGLRRALDTAMADAGAGAAEHTPPVVGSPAGRWRGKLEVA